MSVDTLPAEAGDAAFVARFLETRPPATRRVYGLTIAEFRRTVPVPLDRVTPRHAWAWMAGLTGKPATRDRKLATLHALYQFAVTLRYIPHNPFQGLKKPWPDPDDTLAERVIGESEVQALLDTAASSPKTYALVALILGTGCRISDAAVARWCDFGVTPDGHYGWQVRSGRGRVLKIRPDVFAALTAWRAEQGLPASLNRDDDHFLFPGADGIRPGSPVALSRRIQRCAARAGITRPITAQWLRTAHAVMALVHGATVPQIQHALGHQGPASTLRYLLVARGLEETSADYIPVRFKTAEQGAPCSETTPDTSK